LVAPKKKLTVRNASSGLERHRGNVGAIVVSAMVSIGPTPAIAMAVGYTARLGKHVRIHPRKNLYAQVITAVVIWLGTHPGADTRGSYLSERIVQPGTRPWLRYSWTDWVCRILRFRDRDPCRRRRRVFNQESSRDWGRNRSIGQWQQSPERVFRKWWFSLFARRQPTPGPVRQWGLHENGQCRWLIQHLEHCRRHRLLVQAARGL